LSAINLSYSLDLVEELQAKPWRPSFVESGGFVILRQRLG
jgi:hypothetical protein